MVIKRRDFLYILGAGVGTMIYQPSQAKAQDLHSLPFASSTSSAAGGIESPALTTASSSQTNPKTIVPSQPTFTLPELNYAYDALEPYIDAKTMQIHHDKHHAAYVKNLNDAIAKYPNLKEKTAEDLLINLATLPEDIRTTVRNNGGGHVNHSMFWEIMGPKAGGNPRGPIATALKQAFGSFDGFRQKFNEIGMKRFGSGWVWLVRTKELKLQIVTTPNQDSPLLEGNYPILGNDLWEHAYYLNYQNRRADYLAAWWNVVNWDAVNKRYQKP